jgi:ABC-type transport system involved in multi-copper enzyme maturation permease subunit
MSESESSVVAWFRRHGIGPGLALISAALGLGLFGTGLPVGAQVILWVVLLAAAAVSLRRTWIALLGPVLFYDLVTSSRRVRYILLRCLYAGALLLVLSMAYSQFQLRSRIFAGKDLAKFAETFFHVFMIVQFVAVGLLTPAFCAGAIAEEKERHTMEFLLATSLRDRDIVLGKLIARLGNMVLLLLTGLPVLALTQLWGGVDPKLVLAGFAATSLTLLSLGSLSILQSVYFRRPRDAIALTYMTALAYLVVSFVLARIVLTNPTLATLPIGWGSATVQFGELANWFSAGNLVVAVAKLADAVGTQTLDAVLPGLLRDYAIFQGLWALACVIWAVARLRAVALAPANTPAPTRDRHRRRSRHRPRVGLRPMLWKEIWTEPGLSFNRFGRILVGAIILASFIPALWFAGQFFLVQLSPQTARVWFGPAGMTFRGGLAEAINSWVRVVGTLVACLTLLGVAVRAAGSISGERDRQTLDSLLTTPLNSDSMLYAKWLGSILSVRWAWLWLCSIWSLGWFMGGLDHVSVPWLFVSWLTYAGFLAVVGLWFSVVSRTTLRATLWTVLTTGALGGGHWLLCALCLAPFPRHPLFGLGALSFLKYGLTPPIALAWLAFRSDRVDSVRLEMLGRWGEDPWEAFIGLIVGLVCWAVAGRIWWAVARERFRIVAHRVVRPRIRRPHSLAG